MTRQWAAAVLAVGLLGGDLVVDGAEWTGFRGANRDNISTETGLLKQWPAGGPRLLWSIRTTGEGYGTVSVAGGRAYVMGAAQAGESVHAIDLASGDPAWSTRISRAYQASRGNGPRGTPTIDGDRIYALGLAGDLVCLDRATGRLIWRKNILQSFQGRRIGWAISESVLIDGDQLICTPGGPGATLAALDKKTGDEIWRAAVPGNPAAAYASPIVVNVGGVRQYVNYTNRSTVSVRAKDGAFLWQDTSSSNGTANCSTPLFFENHVFSASGYNRGGALLKLTSQGGRTAAARVYHTRDMKNQHGGMAIVDGFLYGSSDGGGLTCLALKTGRVAWRARGAGKGSITIADGNIYLRTERGPIILAKVSSTAYRELGRFDQPNRSSTPAWAHPVVADGKLFIRDQQLLLCYDVRGK